MVKVALPSAEPPGPEAVRLYTVVSIGDTLWLPLECSTEPTPAEMVTLLALLTLHRRVAAAPGERDVGLTLKLFTLGAGADVDSLLSTAGAGAAGAVATTVFLVHANEARAMKNATPAVRSSFVSFLSIDCEMGRMTGDIP